MREASKVDCRSNCLVCLVLHFWWEMRSRSGEGRTLCTSCWQPVVYGETSLTAEHARTGPSWCLTWSVAAGDVRDQWEPSSSPRVYRPIPMGRWKKKRGGRLVLRCIESLDNRMELTIARCWKGLWRNEQCSSRRKVHVTYSWLKDVINFHLNMPKQLQILVQGDLGLPNSHNVKLPE